MKIHIALAFDDNFWAPAYAVMRSICISTTRRADLVFHLLHMPLLPEHRSDIEKISQEYPAQIVWHDLSADTRFDVFVEDLPISTRWPRVVYARLMLGTLMPADAKRVIYLDCDTMVRWPIEQLFEAEMDGLPVAAVRDAQATMVIGVRDVREKVDIFDPALPYFNSGMLLIDLDQWRQMDFSQIFRDLKQSGKLDRLYYDQDILNLTFQNNWKVLPWRWNVVDAHCAHEGVDPAVLHYTSAKPWGVFAGAFRTTAYARLYRHIMTNELFYRFARHRWKRWWLKKLRLAR